MTGTRPGPRSTELRLALAMRGGVSLAVWMGGACCEVSKLREAAPNAPGTRAGRRTPPSLATPGPRGPDVYRTLLDAGGYRTVDIDVLSGTSAGGLNGVLLACHLVYGMPFDHGVRDVWLRLGDLEDLLRRPALFDVPNALMRGDEVFYGGLRAALETLVPPPDAAFRPASSLRLILTATRLRPRTDWVRPTLGEPLLVGRSNAYFHFRHRGGLTDFPDGEAREEALDRLAYAARTSSSFPVAFEPGRCFVGDDAPQREEAAPRVDMRGISSESGYPDDDLDGCAEFIDGGLLDNIPVAWAVRAVAGIPVTGRADRWLLFLQPVPPFPPEPEKGDHKRATRLVRIAAKSLAVKSGSESLYEDAVEMRAAAAATQLARAVTRALPADRAALQGAALARAASYSPAVGLAGAERLVRLLSDPAGVTGPDPLPVPCGPGPLAQLDRSGGRAPALFARLREAAPALAPTPYSSPVALARAVRLLMDWVVAYENDDTQDEHQAAIAECRELLYAYRFAVSTLTAARDRLLLTAYAEALQGGRMPDGRQGPLGPHALATARLRTAMPDVPADGEPAEVWYRWAQDLAARVTEEPQPAPADGTGAGEDAADPGPYQELLDRISRLGRTIGTALVPAPAGFQALGEAALLGADEMRAALTDAEVILGPLRPDPQSEATDISFHTVSAANDSWAADRVMGPHRTPQETVHGKLSGNQLGNFAAFLSVRWRLADWTWGRLDTAASLVSVVATDERLEHAFGGFTGLPDLRDRVAARLGPCPRFTALWADSLRLRPRMCPWDRVRYVLTAVRQREILDEELPLLAALHREGPTSGNRPRDIPRAQSFLEPDLDAPGALKKGFDALGEVASERVDRLLTAPDPCRAVVRTGLIAWPALQPSGRFAARLPRAVLSALKPLLCLLPVVALFAPVQALVAAALMWTGVAFSTGHWSSLPGHVPLCLFAMAALAALLRSRVPGRPLRLLLMLLLLPALPVVGLWLPRAHLPGPPGADGWAGTLLVGALFALAAAALLFTGSERWGPALGAALFAGALAGLVQFQRDPLGGWWGALILYVVLLWVTVILPWLHPKPESGATQRRSAKARIV